MNKDKIKKLLQDKLEPPFWDSDFDIIHGVYVKEIKEMIKSKKKHITYFQEENRNYNQALDDIITTLTSNSSKIRSKLEDNLTQDTNPKE